MKNIFFIILALLMTSMSYSQSKLLLVHVNVDQNNNVPTGEQSNIVIGINDTIPNNYTVLGDTNSIEDWYFYGIGLVDELVFNDQIKPLVFAKAGVDLLGWGNLSTIEKYVAICYMPNEIITLRGQIFFATETAISGLDPTDVIKKYRSRAIEDRTNRFQYIMGYAEQKLGPLQAIQAVDPNSVQILIPKYINYGALFQTDYNVDAIGDWILATGSFNSSGLRRQLINGTYIILDGTPIDQFVNTMVFILENGIE